MLLGRYRGKDNGVIFTIVFGLLASSVASYAQTVHSIGLTPGKDSVQTVQIAAGTACSFKFPAIVENIILGNGDRFIAVPVRDNIVSLKPKTDEPGLFTNLQVVLQDQRIVTINATTGPLEGSVSQITFFDEGASPVDAAITKQKSVLEKKFREKEERLKETFQEAEKTNFMRDMLYSYRHVEVSGGRITESIGLFPKDLTIRNNDIVFLRVEAVNRSSTPYRIANLQVLEREEGGFLWRGTKKEANLRSTILCTNDQLLVPAKSKESCVVSFQKPERNARHTHVALRMSEAGGESRTVFIRRIKELYQ